MNNGQIVSRRKTESATEITIRRLSDNKEIVLEISTPHGRKWWNSRPIGMYIVIPA